MDILNEICSYVIYSSIVASFIAIVIIFLKFIFKNRFNANWHYYIWFIVILRLLIMELPASELSIFNFLDTSKVTNVIEDTSNPNYILENADIINSLEKSTAYINAEYKSTDKFFIKQYLSDAIPIMWLLGFVIIISATILSYFIFLYKVNKFGKVNSNKLDLILDECKENLNIKKKVKIYYSDIVSTPTVLGLIKKKILMPANLENILSNDEMIHILSHELCHIKRHDIEMNFLMMILQSIHWFNPILWMTFNKIKSDCEVACDELVLKSINKEKVKDYGETIIKLASLVKISKPVRLNLAAIDKKNLKRRIVMISKFKKKSIIITVISIIIIGAICFVCLTNPIDSTTSDNTTIEDTTTDNSEDNKSEEVDKVKEEENSQSESNTADVEKKESVKPATKPTNSSTSKKANDKVYKSKRHNISFTIPSSWEGKYIIEETENEIMVCYILQDPQYKGEPKLFLSIKDKEKYGDTSNMSYERIPNAPEEITVNGKKYLITSPTDTVPTVYDLKGYQKMINESYKLVNSIR